MGTLAIAAIVYFLPFLAAWKRGHKAKLSIFICNVAFGWTILGWLAVLAWSCNSNVKGS